MRSLNEGEGSPGEASLLVSSMTSPSGGIAADRSWFEPAMSKAFHDPTSILHPDLFAYWEHHRVDNATTWFEQHTRRVIDTAENRLVESLTFLRMKHSKEFERISEAIRRAFPEFGGLDFQDTQRSGFAYRPGFIASGGGNVPLARESVGSGAWTYLCVLTAARAAKATGARVLLLDEPHLYLHPGLERLLIDELLDRATWDDKPLQIVAATHSPAFVNAAAQRGTLHVLDWGDGQRRHVLVRRVASKEDSRNLFDHLVSHPSDLLYADRLVFVEGPSDEVALRLLGRSRCNVGAHVRFVPLRETDALKSDVARYFSVIVQSHGIGFQTKGLLLLDGDKRRACEAAWDKLDATLDPRKVAGLQVVWVGEQGNDLESVFCDEAFLVAYFSGRGIPEMQSRPAIQRALGHVKYPATRKDEKGCVAVDQVHEELEQAGGAPKADYLEDLVHFYVATANEAASAAVRGRLRSVEEALGSMSA
jgi:AAA domain, putative AbiEii toxin, Type IV TA system